MKPNPHSLSRRLSWSVASAFFVILTGCSTPQFYANYYVDPKPERVAYSDLTPRANPEPVYVVFDMYSAQGSFPEATQKLGPKVARAIASSHLFSKVSKVGSENMARIQVSMREAAALSGGDTQKLPAGLTSGLEGSRGVIVYEFAAAYSEPGKEPVKKSYPHAVHVVEGNSPALADVFPMTAAHAVDAVVEQVVLTFLRDLQRAGKL